VNDSTVGKDRMITVTLVLAMAACSAFLTVDKKTRINGGLIYD